MKGKQKARAAHRRALAASAEEQHDLHQAEQLRQQITTAEAEAADLEDVATAVYTRMAELHDRDERTARNMRTLADELQAKALAQERRNDEVSKELHRLAIALYHELELSTSLDAANRSRLRRGDTFLTSTVNVIAKLRGQAPNSKQRLAFLDWRQKPLARS